MLSEILPVDWLAITQSGSTRTNYQLFPGDRVYVRADPLIWADNIIAKVISPIQRLLNVHDSRSQIVVRRRHGRRPRRGGSGCG